MSQGYQPVAARIGAFACAQGPYPALVQPRVPGQERITASTALTMALGWKTGSGPNGTGRERWPFSPRPALCSLLEPCRVDLVLFTEERQT